MIWDQYGGQPLTENAFNEAVEILGVDVAKLWVVMDVEAKRCGFLKDRRPIILFERHKFHQKTGGRFSLQYLEISNEIAGG